MRRQQCDGGVLVSAPNTRKTSEKCAVEHAGHDGANVVHVSLRLNGGAPKKDGKGAASVKSTLPRHEKLGSGVLPDEMRQIASDVAEGHEIHSVAEASSHAVALQALLNQRMPTGDALTNAMSTMTLIQAAMRRSACEEVKIESDIFTVLMSAAKRMSTESGRDEKARHTAKQFRDNVRDQSKFVHEAIRDEQDSKVKAMLQLAAEQLRIADSEIEKIEKHDGAGDPARRGTSPAGGGAAPAVSTVGGAWGSAGGNAAPEPP